MSASSTRDPVRPPALRPVTRILLQACAWSLLIGCRAEQQRAEELPLVDLGLLYDDTIFTTSARTVDFNGQALVPRAMRVEKSGAGGSLAVDKLLQGAVFGLRENLTVSLTVPYVRKRLDPVGGAATLEAEGLGDAPVVAKVRFFQRTGPGETTEAAALFGLELPVGRDDVRQGGVTLPAPLQPGSGSLDAIVGAAFTRIRGRWLLNADLIAKLNSTANAYRFGDTLRADVGGHWRAYPARYERYDQTTVNLVAEVNGAWSEPDRAGGSTLANSGGGKLFVTPGLQVITSQSFLFEASVQLPVHMDLRGSQLEEDFVALVGLRLRY